MFEHFLAAVAAMLVCALLLWTVQRLLMTPVKSGKNTAQQVVLSVRGKEPALENNVAGLLWLADCGVLRCRVLILGYDLDEETRAVARLLERDDSRVTFEERDKIPEWTSKTNC